MRLHRAFTIAMVGISALLGGCSDAAIGALNALIPTDGYTLTGDISYGGDPRQHLDVYVPKDRRIGRPVILFFYGGSWKFGAKQQYRFLGEAFTSRGYTVVIADYRLFPQVKFPAFEQDAALALAWTQKHAADYDADPAKIFVMGHSAGANIAALVVLDRTYARAVGAEQGVRGLIGLAGPYAFRPKQTESVKDVFVGTGDLEWARPITFASALRPPPPMLLAHGRDDDTVSLSNTEQMAAAVRAAGGSAREVIYENVGHIGIVAAMAKMFRGRARVLEDVSRFIEDNSRTSAP